MTSREEEIQARLDAASPDGTPVQFIAAHDEEYGFHVLDIGGWVVARGMRSEDAVLIADAPDDLAYLLARVATLETQLEAQMEAEDSGSTFFKGWKFLASEGD